MALPTGRDQVDGDLRHADHRPGRRSPARSTCRTSSSTRTNDVELLDLADQAPQPSVPTTGAAEQQRRRRDRQRAAGRGAAGPARPPVTPADLTAVLAAYTRGRLPRRRRRRRSAAGARRSWSSPGCRTPTQDAAKKNAGRGHAGRQFDKHRPAGGRRQRRRRRQPGRGGPRRRRAGQDDLHGRQRQHRRRARWSPRWPSWSSWSSSKVGQYGVGAGADVAGAAGPPTLTRRSWTSSAHGRLGAVGCVSASARSPRRAALAWIRADAARRRRWSAPTSAAARSRLAGGPALAAGATVAAAARRARAARPPRPR